MFAHERLRAGGRPFFSPSRRQSDLNHTRAGDSQPARPCLGRARLVIGDGLAARAEADEWMLAETGAGDR